MNDQYFDQLFSADEEIQLADRFEEKKIVVKPKRSNINYKYKEDDIRCIKTTANLRKEVRVGGKLI